MFYQPIVEFAGFKLFEDEYQEDSIRHQRISDNELNHRHSIMVWFFNQRAYPFTTAPMMEPFRQLLSSRTFFYDETLNEILKSSKEKIIELVKEGVKIFKPNCPTYLTTDWSKSSIGLTLRNNTTIIDLTR